MCNQIDEAMKYLKEPGLLGRIAEDIRRIGVVGEDDLALTIYLVGTSRLLPQPLAALVTGHSSTGKSYVIRKAASLFPEEHVILAHQISPKALFNVKTKGFLKHKFIVVGERSRKLDDDAAEATRALRELISDGRLTRLVSDMSQEWATVKVEVEGPIAYVESTTLSLNQVFPEDRTRFLVLDTDETEEQTRAVIKGSAGRAKNPDIAEELSAVVNLHRETQRLLQEVEVVVSFADELAGGFPTSRLEARRAFTQLLNLIEASALLHQFQRLRDAKGRVLAAEEDYQIAKRLLGGPFGRTLGLGVSGNAAKLLERLKEKAGQGPLGVLAFTTANLQGWFDCPLRSAQKHVKELARAGLITETSAAKGKNAATYMAGKTPTPEEGEILPELTEQVAAACP